MHAIRPHVRGIRGPLTPPHATAPTVKTMGDGRAKHSAAAACVRGSLDTGSIHAAPKEIKRCTRSDGAHPGRCTPWPPRPWALGRYASWRTQWRGATTGQERPFNVSADVSSTGDMLATCPTRRVDYLQCAKCEILRSALPNAAPERRPVQAPTSRSTRDGRQATCRSGVLDFAPASSQ